MGKAKELFTKFLLPWLASWTATFVSQLPYSKKRGRFVDRCLLVMEGRDNE